MFDLDVLDKRHTDGILYWHGDSTYVTNDNGSGIRVLDENVTLSDSVQMHCPNGIRVWI